MKRLLRSIVDLQGISEDNLKANYFVLMDSGLKFPSEVDQAIFGEIQHHFQQFNSLPSYQTLVDFFEEANEIAALDRLKEVKEAESYIQTNFKRLVEKLLEEERERSLDILLKDTARIQKAGLQIDKNTKLHGVQDAVKYFFTKADNLISVQGGSKLRGDITEDGEEVVAEYHLQKTNPKIGRVTGFENIDKYCKGLRAGEMMLVAGFVGHLKTTFALNYVYNTAVIYGWNAMYFSLEMKYEQIRKIVYAMHSTHPKFNGHPAGFLDYGKLRDGELNAQEEDLLHLVAHDLKKVREWKNPVTGKTTPYGRIIVERPTDDITIPEIKLRAELQNKKEELGLLAIDHAGLVESTGGRRYSDYAIALNYVMKDASKLALNFNDGKGIPVLVPFQTNRTGWKEADKNNGEYNLTALSYANEAERSSSVIIYTFLNDEYRNAGEVKIGCLKNRDNPHFPPFVAKVDWGPRRISTLLDMKGQDVIQELGM